MSLIARSDLERLRDTFAEQLEGAVSLTLSLGKNGERNALARELLKEISSLSSKTSLEVGGAPAEAPTITLTGHHRGDLRFVGLPLGHGLPVFIDAILLASTGRSGLSETGRERLGALNSARRVRVFTTPD